MEKYNKLSNGYIPEFNNIDEYNHCIGGQHNINGADCPNCKKPLILHATINTTDERLNIKEQNFSNMHLLYCMRCSLSWYDFQYQILSNDKINILEVYHGETVHDDWNDAVGIDSFPKKSFGLIPVPGHVEKLYDKLNSNIEISEDEEIEICKFTGNFAPQDVGGYPVVDVSNQIGGRAFLSQRLDDPICTKCAKEMYFVASLTNDNKNNLKISFDSVQIVFFYCPECSVIHAQHSM